MSPLYHSTSQQRCLLTTNITVYWQTKVTMMTMTSIAMAD